MIRLVARHPFLATFVPLGILVLLVQVQTFRLLAERRQAESRPQLDDFGAVGQFSFVGRDGRPVTQADFDGKVWACACFFTCCTESCPQLSGALARLQHELAGRPNVRLVSLTVDPEHDNLEVLDRYAKSFGAKTDRWHFLTGGRDEVTDFIRRRLMLGVDKNDAPDVKPGSRVLHSNKLTLIDQFGHVRGHFDGTDTDEVTKLRDAMTRLAAESR
jgi:protein SCO1/2